MKRICVFAGSSMGVHPEFAAAAEKLGAELAARKLELVYGGSNKGLMGRVADTVLKAGGKAIGVMPTGLIRSERVHTELTEFYEVKTMHERKAKMGELADGFIALPGGYGTFEELFEAVCWGQIGIHDKPIGLLNVNGYYEPLIALVRHAIEAGFIPAKQDELLLLESDPARLLNRMESYTPLKRVKKWCEVEMP